MSPVQNVMVVEDEAIVLLDTVMIVEQLGYAVHAECSNLDAAFEALKSGAPDLALLDINIGRQLVWPLARALKSEGCGIVFVSANHEHPELRNEFPEAPLLDKPTSDRDIEEALGSVAAHHASAKV